jgi:hypothetical protein
VATKLQKERRVTCVPFDLSEDKVVARYSRGSTVTWIREADGTLRPSNSGDTDIWSFHRAWRPTFTRLEGRFRRFNGSLAADGIGGTTATSSSSALEIHADGTFSGSNFFGVSSASTGAASTSRKVAGTYEIDGFEMHVTLSTGEESTMRFLSLTKEQGDVAPQYVYVEGFGFLSRQD